MRSKTVFTIVAVCAATSFHGVLAEAPREVIAEARKFLDYSIEKSRQQANWFEEKWESPIDHPEKLRLGAPYAGYFVPQSDLRLIADGRDLFTGGNLRTYGVPVYTGGAVVGTIRIALRGGEWGFEGLNCATNVGYPGKEPSACFVPARLRRSGQFLVSVNEVDTCDSKLRLFYLRRGGKQFTTEFDSC